MKVNFLRVDGGLTANKVNLIVRPYILFLLKLRK